MKEIALQRDMESVLSAGMKARQIPEQIDNSFGAVLKGAINEVNQVQTEADQAIQELAAGNEKDIHQTMIALEKAEVSFKLMMQVRNKIISAYEEIMRMQV
ncbi:MAG: flagellar hook-basal body complex protein FliE [Desulfatiglandaceae bacterium]|jgi:flagellar hook-basal body complex protein FliE